MKLEDLKVGDPVRLSLPYGQESKEYIQRLTKTQIILKSNSTIKYNRRTGRKIGASSWDRYWLYAWTEKDEENHIEQRRINKNAGILELISKLDPDKLTEDHRIELNDIEDYYNSKLG